MQRIEGYDNAQAYTGEITSLPAGKYVCKIEGARDTVTQTGKRQLVLMLDIAEGEYEGYFSAAYKRSQSNYGKDAKWSNGGLYRQGYEGKQLPWFKGLMTAIEAWNAGYRWNWDESTLKGKFIGIVFGREQYIGSDGQPRLATKALMARSPEGLETAEVPADKLLPIAQTGASGYVDLDASEDDLPF